MKGDLSPGDNVFAGPTRGRPAVCLSVTYKKKAAGSADGYTRGQEVVQRRRETKLLFDSGLSK